MKPDEKYEYQGCIIPLQEMNSIRAYIDEGQVPGLFIQALICNDLTRAYKEANPVNLANMVAFVHYIYQETPDRCHGSRRTMNAWIKKKSKPDPKRNKN